LDIIDVEQGYRTQASLYARYGMLWAKAKSLVNGLTDQLKVEKAQLRHAVRTNDPSVKQDDQRALVEMNRRLVRIQSELRRAEYRVDVLRIALDSLVQRKDMLISYGATLRQEREADIRILKKKAVKQFDKSRRRHGR
tara:strand:- start:108 stop:521 length:414 start_codon:yes stop_codon:yes gene_type:complete